MNPLLAAVVLPPRLAVRALDDLHTLATTAQTAVERAGRNVDRLPGGRGRGRHGGAGPVRPSPRAR